MEEVSCLHGASSPSRKLKGKTTTKERGNTWLKGEEGEKVVGGGVGATLVLESLQRC